MRARGHEEAAFALYARKAQLFDFLSEGLRIDHHSVAYDAEALFVKYAGRYESQYEFALAYSDSVARVMPALIARHYIEMRRENIHHLAFAFVAPLSADHDYVFHGLNPGRPQTGSASRFRVAAIRSEHN
jgi:hypothetical protein